MDLSIGIVAKLVTFLAEEINSGTNAGMALTGI